MVLNYNYIYNRTLRKLSPFSLKFLAHDVESCYSLGYIYDY